MIRTSRRDYQVAALWNKPHFENRLTPDDVAAKQARVEENAGAQVARSLKAKDFVLGEVVIVPGGRRGKIDSIDTRFGRIYVRIGRAKAEGYSPTVLMKT